MFIRRIDLSKIIPEFKLRIDLDQISEFLNEMRLKKPLSYARLHR